jgi:predicted PurR-regulated permease PerM
MTASTIPSPAEANAMLLRKAVEIAIRLAALAALGAWCFIIFRPFVMPILWAVVIGVALYPMYAKLRGLLGGSDKIAATLFVLAGLTLIIVPTWRFASGTIDSIQSISQQVETGIFTVPGPPERVRTWPLIGERAYTLWSQASTDMEATLSGLAPQLRRIGSKALDLLRGLGSAVIQTIIAIIIAGFMLAHTEGSRKTTLRFATRLTGERGEEIVVLMVKTIRSVAQGVLGVALIQATLATVGLILAGVPGAGLWGLLVLVLAVMQLPPLLVLGPIIPYVFAHNDSTVVAIIFTVWSIIVSISDGFLKPMFLGRGVDVPMPVILIGAIGGMIAHGILGLFIGAIVLAVGYMMYKAWMQAGADPIAAISSSGTTPVLSD